MKPEFSVLEGRFVRLEPFAVHLRDEVRAALDGDADTWAIMASNARGEAFEGWWAAALRDLRAGERLPYAIRRLADGRIVGTSSYMGLRPADRGLEIGSTFLHPDARRGPVNPESKRLMLAHAFAAGIIRAEFMIDRRNARSQAAVAKLGAKAEGVLRRNRVTWTGHIRDTAVFSITDLDWPAVREGLDARLEGFAESDL
jgi:RimJ/RimL family protein N-acetyltransferase